jgi:hypothetical protein
MAGVWSLGGEGRWRPLTATGFVSEADLHDLIEETPAMLPLAGAPRLAIVGKEVNCGRERADLLAVEVETGRPVVIEIKLASNTDRRRSLTQVLSYAAHLRRLDGDGLGRRPDTRPTSFSRTRAGVRPPVGRVQRSTPPLQATRHHGQGRSDFEPYPLQATRVATTSAPRLAPRSPVLQGLSAPNRPLTCTFGGCPRQDSNLRHMV